MIDTLTNMVVRRSGWNDEEDAALCAAVWTTGKNNFDEFQWTKIARLVPDRNAHACRMRWTNHVDPEICKGTWEPADYAILVKAHVSLSKRESFA
jgi:hypothetical protein